MRERTNKVYRAGVVGLGRIGSGLDDEWFDQMFEDESFRLRPCTHAGIYRLHPKTELVAGADIDEEELAAFSRKWNVDKVYADYREMLDKEDLDIVSIAVLTPLHHEVALNAVKAGVKAILCEKPIALSLQQADEMIQVCEENNVKLTINYSRHFDPNVQKAKELVDSGTIGELRTIVGYWPRQILHTGSHFFDMMCLFGGEPDYVFGHIEGDDTVDANATGYVHFKSGVRGLFDVRPKISHGALELMGTKGLMRYVSGTDPTWELWLPSKGKTQYGPGSVVQHDFSGVPQEVAEQGVVRGRCVTIFALDEVVKSLDEDRESISSGRKGIWPLEIAMGVYHSHKQGGVMVELPLEERSLEIMPALRSNWPISRHPLITNGQSVSYRPRPPGFTPRFGGDQRSYLESLCPVLTWVSSGQAIRHSASRLRGF